MIIKKSMTALTLFTLSMALLPHVHADSTAPKASQTQSPSSALKEEGPHVAQSKTLPPKAPDTTPKALPDLNDDFKTWTKVDTSFIAKGFYLFNGQKENLRAEIYPLKTGDINGLFANRISYNGKYYYYANGVGATAPRYFQWLRMSNRDSDNLFYTRKDENGNDQLAKVSLGTNSAFNTSFQTEEILTMSPNGEFIHNVKVLNLGPTVTGYFMDGVDTNLNGNDNINIYADGNDGVYMETGDFRLYGDGLSNIGVFQATYGIMLQGLGGTSAKGKAKGTLLANNVDSAILYKTPSITLKTGDAYSYAYKESIKLPASVTVKYVDTNGSPIAGQTDETLVGKLGEVKTVTPKTIPGYKFVKQTGLTSGNKITITDAPQTVTLTYASLNVEFGSVPNLNFGEHKISGMPQRYPAQKDKDLTIKDNRASGGFTISAKMAQPFTGIQSHKTLGEVVYTTADNQEVPINASNSILYASKGHQAGDTVISDFWGNNKGFNLKVAPGQALNDSYTGAIQWTLSDVPQ